MRERETRTTNTTAAQQAATTIRPTDRKAFSTDSHGQTPKGHVTDSHRQTDRDTTPNPETINHHLAKPRASVCGQFHGEAQTDGQTPVTDKRGCRRHPRCRHGRQRPERPPNRRVALRRTLQLRLLTCPECGLIAANQSRREAFLIGLDSSPPRRALNGPLSAREERDEEWPWVETRSRTAEAAHRVVGIEPRLC